jgi:hypothetical protein
MEHSLQDKLAALEADRRARIEAEADRLQDAYQRMQKSPDQQDDEPDDPRSDHR